MSKVIPKRSMGGCLTCKRRKKKCDERRPYCRRCELGDFDCLGYNSPDTCYTGTSILWPSHTPAIPFGTPSSQLLKPFISLPGPKNEVEQPSPAHALSQQANGGIPRGVLLHPTILEDVTSAIVAQYVRFSRDILFRASLISIEKGILQRMNNSNITRWSMYLGARVVADLLSGINVQKYLGWIFRFCQQITETSTSNELGPSLEARLSGFYDLVYLSSIISGTANSYSLFQRCTPMFLQLATLSPEIWVHNSSISVPETFRSSKYEVTQFIVHDTITALALGISPQLQYDTTSIWVDRAPGHYMEWIHGFPVGILILLAEINSWRTLRMMGVLTPNQNDYHNIENRLNRWNPIVDHTDEPTNDIARLAVQEAWRQAALIYLYLAMSEVNSADPRAERAVQQVVQLGNTIPEGSPLALYLLAPSLIAGVAARQDKHRAALRNRVANENPRKMNLLVLPVRGTDFLPVLDHLWHGVGPAPAS
ncbi:hypothetical protein RSOLAG22IIIB_04861 [Rhizoctonia solani]|uniref:Zn(2)-C6 fungal-type domain-containing protein n=1 Tax=Rhizoctonia solani TaxID=456999 RepID=A0A0K6G188_9AGAM|nr:hypothetical protein RSOLAG22IIIB_04861 [Rhizoctonia solani]